MNEDYCYSVMNNDMLLLMICDYYQSQCMLAQLLYRYLVLSMCSEFLLTSDEFHLEQHKCFLHLKWCDFLFLDLLLVGLFIWITLSTLWIS